VIGDGAVAGDDVETGAAECPPGFWDAADGDEALMEDVFFAEAFSPLTLEDEGGVGLKDTGALADFGRGGAAEVVEASALFIEEILNTFGVDFFAALEVAKLDAPASLGIAGSLVVVDFVGAEEEVGGFEGDGAAEVIPGTFALLGDGADKDFVGAGGVDAGDVDGGRRGLKIWGWLADREVGM
jgi:hypothetical protein